MDTPKDANKLNREDRKKLFKECKEGNNEHKQYKSLSKNLIPLNERTEEEQKEIRRKGAQAVNQLKGERKTAKQILDTILPLYANNNAIKLNENIGDDIKQLILSKNIKVTQYDLLYMAMLYKAQNGDVKSAEFIRDTYGEKPTDKVHNINESLTDSDKRLLNNLYKRMGIDEPIDIE